MPNLACIDTSFFRGIHLGRQICPEDIVMRVFRHNMPVLDIIMSKAGILCHMHTFFVTDDTIMCKCDIFVGHAYKYVTSVHKNVCMYTLLCH